MSRPRLRRCLVITLAWAGCAPEEGPPHPYRPDGGAADARDDGDDHRVPADRPGGELTATDALPAYWACNPLYYNTRDGCDCGCGIADPDCVGSGCETPGCDAAGCAYCHASGGIDFICGTTPPPVGWSCTGVFYGDGECDCGCSSPDIDCGSGGCAVPDCRAAGCGYCWGPESGGTCSG